MASAAPALTLLLGGLAAEEVGERAAAVIDLGSNSWRLVTYAYVPGATWRVVGGLNEPVRIAEGLSGSGRLGSAAIAHGLETLEVFAGYCRARGLAPEDVDVVATSAIRDAVNGPELLEQVRELTGFGVDVLTAQEEAEYGYVAAVNSSRLEDGAVLDIGGGSLQLIGVAGRRPTRTGSWPLGAIRVTERLLPGSGPVPRKLLRRARAAVHEELGDAGWLAGAGDHLVGIGGAVRNLAAAAQRLHGEPGPIQGSMLPREDLRRLIARMAELPAPQRALPGIKSSRGDFVLGAAVALDAVLELGGFDAMEVTSAGLREGVFLSRRLLAGGEPLVGDVRAASLLNTGAVTAHSEHVARLALQLRDSLAPVPAAGERELLQAAALLHDAAPPAAGLAGFSPRDVELIGAILRARKGGPEPGQPALVGRCAVLVRLAEQLDRAEDQSVAAASLEGGRLRLTGEQRLARWSVERRVSAGAFQRAFGVALNV